MNRAGAWAYLFPGQGSQWVGMGQALYETYPQARVIFAQADDVLGINLSRLCFEGPEDELTDTVNAQPAILTASVAALEVLKGQSLYATAEPSFVAGHSMGEFSALVAAGSLGFEDALLLVRERGRLMKLAGERSPGGMAAVIGLDVDVLGHACAEARESTGGVAQIANDNCPGQVVISGDQETLALVMEKAQASGAKKVVRLAVSIASHSPLMGVITDEFGAVVDAAPIVDAQLPIVANVSAAPVNSAADIRAELKAQLTSPVRWTESVRWLIDQGVTQVLEVGPKDVLANLMKRIDRQIKRTNVGDTAEINL